MYSGIHGKIDDLIEESVNKVLINLIREKAEADVILTEASAVAGPSAGADAGSSTGFAGPSAGADAGPTVDEFCQDEGE